MYESVEGRLETGEGERGLRSDESVKQKVSEEQGGREGAITRSGAAEGERE